MACWLISTQALERCSGEIVPVGMDYEKDKADNPCNCVMERADYNKQ